MLFETSGLLRSILTSSSILAILLNHPYSTSAAMASPTLAIALHKGNGKFS